MTLRNKVIEWLKDNTDELRQLVSNINSYDDNLSELYFINMEDFDDYMEGKTPWDIARSIHFGSFNPTDDYFKFNVYENLESFSEYDIQNKMEDSIDKIADLCIASPENYDLPDELQELIDSYGYEESED